MISEDQIKRINELAKKQKTVGLTPEETEEQKVLRRLYIDAVKENLRATLDQVTDNRQQQGCSCGHCNHNH
jgi:uncharacterized protein YnzC (UPF0291/DUF896 family)